MENSAPLAPSRFFINQRFDDFDAFAEAAQGWDLHFDQLDRGAFDAELWQCCVPGVEIGRGRFSRRLQQQGAAPAGMHTFVIPAQQELNLNWRRQDVGRDDLLVNPFNGEFYSISNTCFDVFTISVTEELLEKAARAIEAERVPKFLRSEEVVRLSHEASDRLRIACHALFNRLQHQSDQFDQGMMDELLLIEFPRLVVQAISESIGEAGPIPKARERTRALKRANDAIIEFANVPITVGRLCKVSGMSERSLQYAFREKFGLSPKAYLQSYRLNRVRKRLRGADPASTMIADLANEWGFWHMGQFAKDYKRQFGELPSVTVQK